MLGIGINLWRTALTHGGAIPDPPVLTALVVTAPSTADTGVSFNFTVKAVDQHGLTFPGYAGTVHFTSTDSIANLPANATLTAGVGVFSAKFNTVGSFIISATDTVTPALTGASAPVLVSSGSPAAPTVLSALPATGAAGTPVVLTGTNFTGATSVTFDGVPATSFSVVNATTINAVAPAGSPGPADVHVTTPNGTGLGAGIFTYGTVTFTPASLFASGEVGAWYDWSDMSTVYADRGGTLLASIGNLLGRVRDKSGNGNDIINTLFDYPGYVSIGGVKAESHNPVYSYPDMTSHFSAPFVPPITVIAAIHRTDSNPGSNFWNAYVGTRAYQDSGGSDGLETQVKDANGAAVIDPGDIGMDQDHVVTVVYDATMKEQVDNGTVRTIASTDTSDTQGVNIGCDAGGSGHGHFRIYEFVCINRLLTSQEISDTKAFLTAKLPSPSTAHLPTVGGVLPDIYADFAAGEYWANGVQYTMVGLWAAALGGIYGRSSEGRFFDRGVLRAVSSSSQPRFPTALDGTPRGIRLTGPVTNMVIQSYDLTQSNWVALNSVVSIAGNGPDNPDLPAPMYKITANAGSAKHYIYQSVPGYAAGKLTCSVFMKAKEYNHGWISANSASGTSGFTAVFDLTTGAVTSTQSFGSPTGLTYGSIPLANGWFLLWTTFDTAAGGGYIQFGPSDVAVPTYSGIFPQFVGDGASGVLVFGPQATNTKFLGDYVPTSTAAATQGGETLGFPFAQTTFSVMVETNQIRGDADGGRVIGIEYGYITPIMAFAGKFVASDNLGVMLDGPTVTDMLARNKTMVASNNTNAWITSNGAVPLTSALATLSSASFYLGSSYGGGGLFLEGNLSKIAIWSNRVATPSEMQSLTT
jgi:hypothetical protein